jgi:hypothetical protein
LTVEESPPRGARAWRRLSANSAGRFSFSTPAQRRASVRDIYYALNTAVSRLLEDGSFLLAAEGGEAKLKIRSVATGDDVLKAKAAGAEALAAKLFLPEAAEAAAKVGVKLINIQDIADPLALVIKELLKARRPELLTRLFQVLLPDAAVRSYSYEEYAGIYDEGIPSTASFSVKAVFAGDAAKYFEDVLELFSAIASKTSDLGMYTSLNSTLDPRWKQRKVVLDLKTDLPK